MQPFDPSQFGATPVDVTPAPAAPVAPAQAPAFDPSSFGATPVDQGAQGGDNSVNFGLNTSGQGAPAVPTQSGNGLFNSLGSILSGAYKSYAGGVDNFMQGASKEGASMLGDLYDASGKGFGAVTNGLNAATGGIYPKYEPQQVMTPEFVAKLNQAFPNADTTTGGAIGKGFSTIAPYFLGEGEANAAKNAITEGIKGMGLAEKLTPILGETGAKTAAKVLETAMNIGGHATVEGTRTGLIGGAENGMNPEDVKKNFEFGFAGQTIAEGVSGLIKSIAPSVADSLQKSMLKMSPAEQRQYGSKVSKVVDFLNSEKIIGTPTQRYQKVDAIYDGMENKLQKVLTENPTVTASKSSLIDQLNQLKDHPEILSGENGSTAEARAQIDKAIEQLNVQKVNTPVAPTGKMSAAEYLNYVKGGGTGTGEQVFKDQITLDQLNKLKRGFYGDAYNEKGTKVLDTINKYIGDIFKGNIESEAGKAGLTVDGMKIEDFNKKYGTVIDSRRILNAAQYKPQTGTATRAIASLATLTSGQPIIDKIIEGSIAPKLIDNLAGSLPKSLISSGLETGANAISPGKVLNFEKMFAPGRTQK